MDNIADIRERCEAATPGPWDAYIKNDGIPAVKIRQHAIGVLSCKENAEFIAHAREDIPYLLGEVERLIAESDGLVKLPAGHMRDRITDQNAKYNAYAIHSACYAGMDGSCNMPHCSGCPIRKMYIVMQDIENQAEAVLAAQDNHNEDKNIAHSSKCVHGFDKSLCPDCSPWR